MLQYGHDPRPRRSLTDRVLRIGEGRLRRQLQNLVAATAAFEPAIADLDDTELRAQTEVFRDRISQGQSLDDLLPEAFATVREAARRTLGQRHFDVQVMGGAALHLGNIAEMKTGQGKTLVATLPAYLNALTGAGVHVVTVNDYLASYQSELMGRVYAALGMTTGCILSGQDPATRRAQYAADITYGTNNEFGFDYLRDNMATDTSRLVQRGHHFAIVDEVDSILIDEARTPLIISGPAPGDTAAWHAKFATLLAGMRRGDHYDVDEKKQTVAITEDGITAVESWLEIDNLYTPEHTPLIGFLNNAIKAKELFARDKDYIVRDGQVLIVDEHTGRVLPGRRFNEGLHQALEAKEQVTVKPESQTFATVTLQNYFRMYDKLAGMTGTAETEAAEFWSTYKMNVVPIPTNTPTRRLDAPDLVYQTRAAKLAAVVADITARHAKGQPVLVGTTSVAASEELSGMLTAAGVAHQVLNAKQHEREAHVVAQAGRLGAVTVATNMAGRGTDIMLGGNAEELARAEMEDAGLEPGTDEHAQAWPQALARAQATVAAERPAVEAAGGLYVLGTERHESRRIDNQLRGRSGRQGDPGESRFYLSMQDDLMRLFNTKLAEQVLARTGPGADKPVESKIVAKSIASAQAQVEGQHFEQRKNVLKYDDVLSRQRETIYAERLRVLHGEDLTEQIGHFLTDTIDVALDATLQGAPRDWDLDALWRHLTGIYRPTIVPADVLLEVGGPDNLTRERLREEILSDARLAYQAKVAEIGTDTMVEVQRRILLAVVDRHWREHLYEMDYLREGIGLRTFAQRDPLVEYQTEAHRLFAAMSETIKGRTLSLLFRLRKVEPQEPASEGADEASSPAARQRAPEAA